MAYYKWKDASGQWRWYLQAANGRKVAESGESYVNEGDCDRGIELVKGSGDAPVYRK